MYQPGTTRYQVPGTRCLVPDTWYLVPGAPVITNNPRPPLYQVSASPSSAGLNGHVRHTETMVLLLFIIPPKSLSPSPSPSPSPSEWNDDNWGSLQWIWSPPAPNPPPLPANQQWPSNPKVDINLILITNKTIYLKKKKKMIISAWVELCHWLQHLHLHQHPPIIKSTMENTRHRYHHHHLF